MYALVHYDTRMDISKNTYVFSRWLCAKGLEKQIVFLCLFPPLVLCSPALLSDPLHFDVLLLFVDCFTAIHPQLTPQLKYDRGVGEGLQRVVETEGDADPVSFAEVWC